MNHTRKVNKAKRLSGFGNYPQSCKAVFDQLPESVIEHTSAKLLADIAKAISTAYHSGRASTGAEMIDTDAVYISRLKRIVEIPTS